MACQPLRPRGTLASQVSEPGAEGYAAFWRRHELALRTCAAQISCAGHLFAFLHKEHICRTSKTRLGGRSGKLCESGCEYLLSRFSHVWLFVSLWTVAPGSSVHGKHTGMGCHALLQGSSWLKDWTWVSYVSWFGRQTLGSQWKWLTTSKTHIRHRCFKGKATEEQIVTQFIIALAMFI